MSKTRIEEIKRLYELEEKSRNDTIEEVELPELFNLRKEYAPTDIFYTLLQEIDRLNGKLELAKETLMYIANDGYSDTSEEGVPSRSEFWNRSRETLKALESENVE